MKLKLFLLSLTIICLSSFAISAQSSLIHYFPVGDLTLCKGCGHARSDIWRSKFRIENLSNKDLIFYGHYFEGEFLPSGMIQHRNPDVCEWQFWNGKTQDIEWSEKSSLDKEEFLLKAKQSIEFEAHFGEDDFNKSFRFTFYVATKSEEVPETKISDAFSLSAKPIEDENGKILDYEKPSFASVDKDCDPRCKLSIDQSPNIRGIKLGMTETDFLKAFPKAKISKLKNKKYKIKYGWLWNWNEDVYDIGLIFLDGRVVRIEAKFNSLKNARNGNNFYLMVADKLGLKDFWTPFSSKFECREFLIEVLSNEMPTITIWDKIYIDVQNNINKEFIRGK